MCVRSVPQGLPVEWLLWSPAGLPRTTLSDSRDFSTPIIVQSNDEAPLAQAPRAEPIRAHHSAVPRISSLRWRRYSTPPPRAMLTCAEWPAPCTHATTGHRFLLDWRPRSHSTLQLSSQPPATPANLLAVSRRCTMRQLPIRESTDAFLTEPITLMRLDDARAISKKKVSWRATFVCTSIVGTQMGNSAMSWQFNACWLDP